mgnify:CR=1 FL=1
MTYFFPKAVRVFTLAKMIMPALYFGGYLAKIAKLLRLFQSQLGHFRYCKGKVHMLAIKLVAQSAFDSLVVAVNLCQRLALGVSYKEDVVAVAFK